MEEGMDCSGIRKFERDVNLCLDYSGRCML